MKANKKKFWMIASILFTIFYCSSFGLFMYSLVQLNIIPIKYLFFGFCCGSFLYFLFIYVLLRRASIFLKVIFLFIMGILSTLLFYMPKYLNHAQQFLNHIQTKDYDILTYSVITLKDSGFSTVFDLNGKSVAYLNDPHQPEVSNYLEEKINFNKVLKSDFGGLVDDLLNKRVESICLEESYLLLVQEEIEDFKEEVVVLDTFEVKIENSLKEDSSSLDTSFVLYISGIDQYGKVGKVRGRSDVNQIAVVNPKTRHILLVNTPRDYYVQLAGTSGLKDKLTHAGIYGIEKSIATLENLYGMNIDYYLRVNFDSLIKCVDVVGGIDIYSDASFTCWTNRSVHVNKGWNHFNGTEALAYSRERYAYQTGDHHRGENQQQVITAILNKVSQSSVLISKYHQILNVLEDSFQTNMPSSMITSFVKGQLEDLSVWNIESTAVGGIGSKNYTYSMGRNHLLYVMEPDYGSVSKAANKMREVYSE